MVGISRTESLRFGCRTLIPDLEFCRLIPPLSLDGSVPPKEDHLRSFWNHNREKKSKSFQGGKTTLLGIRWFTCPWGNQWKKSEYEHYMAGGILLLL